MGSYEYKLRVTGRAFGVDFCYESDGGFWPEGNSENDMIFWWEGGNGACDCNRAEHIPPHLSDRLKKNSDGSFACGDEIVIYQIEDVDGHKPTLFLDE